MRPCTAEHLRAMGMKPPTGDGGARRTVLRQRLGVDEAHTYLHVGCVDFSTSRATPTVWQINLAFIQFGKPTWQNRNLTKLTSRRAYMRARIVVASRKWEGEKGNKE
jgi:hypothetical protein